MYIDSPNFPRRKVIGADKHAGILDLGSDRSHLANFVAQELESHSNDAAILQKFRKEAEEYKRNLLRGKHTYTKPTLPHPIVSNFAQPVSLKKLAPSQSIDQVFSDESIPVKELKQLEVLHPNPDNKPQVIIVQQRDNRSFWEQQQILSQLKKRDHLIERQSKKLKKNQEKMRVLAKRLEHLENDEKTREAERMHRMEEESYGRIHNLMTSMSSQLIENQSYIEKSLFNLNKKIQHQGLSQSVGKVTNAPKAKRKQPDPSYRHNPEDSTVVKPTIAYSYNLGREESDRRVNSIISSLENNRNRLDALNKRRVSSIQETY